MNKWLFFACGLVLGIILALVIVHFSAPAEETKQTPAPVAEKTEEPEPESEDEDGIHYFEEPGDIIEGKSFEVFQVIANDAALVHGKSDYDMYLGPVYLLVNNEKKYYYDEEIVKVPSGKVVRQVGIYRYATRNERIKTVPIIMIMDK